MPQTATLKAPTPSKAELAEEEAPSAEDKAASEATREEVAVATLSGEAVEEEEEEEQVTILSGATREEVEEEEEPWTHSGRTSGDTAFRTSILRQNRHAIIRGQRIYGTVDMRSLEHGGFTVQSTRDH